jgi:hypothetical protein
MPEISMRLRYYGHLPVSDRGCSDGQSTIDSFGDDLITAASLAEDIVSELVAVADTLGYRGNTVIAVALLKEARRHNVQAIRLRAQAGARRKRRLRQASAHQPFL